VDAEFLEVFGESRIRPHVHLPVQSGSDEVLSRMARPYRREKVLRAVGALRKVRDDPFLAADFIAGFPGEGEADHRLSMELAREAGFAWIHAFPFSARPGTKAWDMVPRVPERVAGERVEELASLARAGREAYVATWLGREVDAVLEGEPGGEGGERHATTENYLKALVRELPAGMPSGSAIRLGLDSLAAGGRGEARSRDSGESGDEGGGEAVQLGAADFVARSLPAPIR
jgi:threonylcarbamoyladenosine tRNA methylthiotransferase MtaB